MAPHFARQMNAIGEASSGSREHDRTGRRHEVSFIQYGSHRWVSRCSCRGFQSPEVCDRQTAWQAHDAHRREEMRR